MAGKMDGIITQMNIRNNVREMQESVQELYAWEDEIKRKEAEMRKSRPSDVPREPEVRGKAPIVQPGGDSTMYQPSPRLLHDGAARKKRVKKKKTSKKLLDKPTGTAAGHTYDYFRSRWDKFDVDAALAEVDDETEYETDDEDIILKPAAQNGSDRPIRQKRSPQEEAEFWRNKGNDYFKFGDLRKAKECYTTSIEALPSAAAYANRALMSIKAKEWMAAEADCAQAIQCERMYLKAWQRRALARRESGDMHGCLADLDMALRLSPESAAIRKELRAALVTELSSRGLQLPEVLHTVHVEGLPEIQEAAVRTSGAAVGRVREPAEPSSLGLHMSEAQSTGMPETQKAMVRASEAAVGDVGEEAEPYDSRATIAAPLSQLESRARVSTSRDSMREAMATDGIGAAAVDSAAYGRRDDGHLRGTVAAHTDSVSAPAGEHQDTAILLAAAAAKPSEDGDTTLSCELSESAQRQQRSSLRAADASSAAQPVDLSESRRSSTHASVLAGDERSNLSSERKDTWVPPATSTDFERSWRSCKGDMRKQISYLATINPKSLPQVFRSLLTPTVLEAIVGALLQQISSCCETSHTTGDHGGPSASFCIEMLRELQSVERFSMNILLVPSKRRQELKAAWGAAENALAGDAELLLGLQRCQKGYRL